MFLTIRVLNGDLLTYEYNDETTIGDIKKELLSKDLKNATKIRLIYQNKLLEDEKTLSEISYTSDKEILAYPFPPCRGSENRVAPVAIRATNKMICATPPPNISGA